MAGQNVQLSPMDVFAISSGIDSLKLKLLFSIIFIALLLLAYMWAINNGYLGIVKNLDIWGWFKLVLWGAALLLIVVAFFIY